MLKLHGLIPPLVTPLVNGNTLDEPGLEKLIEHQINGGANGLFLLGTTGEGPHLNYSIRKELIKKSVNTIQNRIPVLVGITDTSVDELLQMAEFAAKVGADALVIAAPYYLPVSQLEMITYFEFVIPKLPLPVLIYNMPMCTQIHMSFEVVNAAKDLGAVGIKDSSGDWEYLQKLIETYKNDTSFSIYSGNENLMVDALKLGASGVVAGGANMFPSLYAELYTACKANNEIKINELFEKVIWVNHKIYGVGQYASKYIKSIKTVLSLFGICNDFVVSPFSKSNKEERAQLERNLKEFNFKL